MKPIIMGVAGGTGSGKTTVAREIASRLGAGVAILEQDGYYKDQSHLPLVERRKINYDHPDAFDMELLLRHLRELAKGRSIDKPTYSFETYSRQAETVRVDPRPVIVVEGIMVLAEPVLRRSLDVKIYVDADADVRFIRRILRDVKERGRSIDSVVDQYMSVVRPMHLQFIEPSKRYADIIIPEGGRNEVAIDLIAAKINTVIAAVGQS